MIKNLILYFIPEKFHEAEETFRKCRLLINTFFLTSLFSTSYVFISTLIGFEIGVYAMVFNAVSFLILPFVFRAGGSIILCANLYVFIGTVGVGICAYYSGGFSSPVMPWLAVLPITALLLAGSITGGVWTAISLTIVTVFGLMDSQGFEFPMAYNLEWKEFFAISDHAGLVLIIFVVALVFEQGKNIALFRLGLKTEEVTKQKEELQVQNKIVEEKNKDIMDSIRYAERIQNAILPSDEEVQKLLNDIFVLFKPKDIVSGDFYWLSEKGEKVFFAAADCTGHGVPGAFMSMIGNALLEESVNEKAITNPAEILNEVRRGIINALKQKGEAGEQKDGMDIALCAWDKSSGTLEFSGAYNGLFLIRKSGNPVQGNTNGEHFTKEPLMEENSLSLFEIKGDKQPVAVGYDSFNESPFTNHSIQIQKEDHIYIFSDGYQDQFGGPKGKKYMTKQLKKYLISIYEHPMQEQMESLDKNIEEWMNYSENGSEAHNDQVDDILMIGVKF